MPKTRPPKPTPDPWKIYQLAERYFEASHLLEKHAEGEDDMNEGAMDQDTMDEKWGAGAPQLLVDSFAIELYLKCLYVLDTNTAPPIEHDWEKLFVALETYIQGAIRDEFNISVSSHPILFHLKVINPQAFEVGVTDFDRSLKAARNTFHVRRYLYEEQPTGEWFYAHLFRDAVRAVTGRAIRLAGLDKSHK
jgi:hypothetical protein